MNERFFTDRQSRDQEPLHAAAPARDSLLKELLAILAVVAFADLAIYRSHGCAGPGLFLLIAPWLLYFGKAQRRGTLSLWCVGGMLALVCARLTWYGSPLLMIIGFTWLMAFATALNGLKPDFLDVLTMTSQSVVAGVVVLSEYLAVLRGVGPAINRRGGLNVILPAVALLVFGTLFILANPDIVTFFDSQIQRLLNAVSDWFIRWALQPVEFLFWIGTAWITAGLLRPMQHLMPLTSIASRAPEEAPTEAPLFAAFRNMLLAVIGLFGVYLIFEFYSLWTRDFPPGFYYAGYAHQGAAWLTAALALATLTLSLVFSGLVQYDPRLRKLRALAWIWSLQNLLLSLAVYNRLFIYIDFNGMTRMRIVGLFGISVVVVGFLLVIWKIACKKEFLWLIQRQIWALAVAIYLFALTPVDYVAASYNVRRILAGKLSDCMQIGVQKLDLEGAMALPPLLDCSTREIREGVAALIAERYLQLQSDRETRKQAGWTAYQLSDRVALDRFQSAREKWKKYENDAERAAAIQEFHDFAYAWY